MLTADAPLASLDAPVHSDNARTLGEELAGTEPALEVRVITVKTRQALRAARAGR